MTLGARTATKIDFTERARPVSLEDLPTPVLTLDLKVVTHNIDTMAAWCLESGVDLAPHGKTTMAPEIWHQQLDAGAWGITVATAYQAEIAREAGVKNILLAGTTFAPDALARLAAPGSDVFLWVDSLDAVRLVDAALEKSGAERQLPILVELGAVGARTGARSIPEAVAVAEAVVAAPHLVLAGVAGYEAAVTHSVDAPGIQLVDDYLTKLIEFRDLLDGVHFSDWLARGGDVVLTAGGSIYFDRVVDALAFRHDPFAVRGVRTRVVLRSGSYVTHDHDLYRRLTPFARTAATSGFLPALDLWASVISRPEPTLALLNVGRRDTSDDEGLPLVLDAYRARDGGARRVPGAVDRARVTRLNDQHAFVTLPVTSELAVGDVVRLGISHPCTTLDRWAEVATILDGRGDSHSLPTVVGSVVTRF